MDSLSDKEFTPLFERVSHGLDMKGCTSPEDINDRIDKKIHELKKRRKWLREQGWQSKRNSRNLWQYKKLRAHGFGDRAINEAMAHPQGIEMLTFQHGAKKAREILLHRKQTRRRRERQRFRNRRELR